jgi:hypothetical protein
MKSWISKLLVPHPPGDRTKTTLDNAHDATSFRIPSIESGRWSKCVSDAHGPLLSLKKAKVKETVAFHRFPSAL